jgi:hypothetical protein
MNPHNVFDQYAEEYDTWFDAHPWVYQSEVRAVKMVLPQSGEGLFVVISGITIWNERTIPAVIIRFFFRNMSITGMPLF